MIDGKTLGFGSPSTAEWQDHLWREVSVPVSVRRVLEAEPVWINWGWFHSKGLNTLSEDVRNEVCAWLVREFAFVVVEARHDSSQFAAEEATFFADRYGGNALGRAGGSGRCAYTNGFYVKGIGPTPLRDPTGPFFHTHGALPLEEAIREAILSEVAGAEFPYGAIPCVAIITIPLRLHHCAEDTRGEPRALLIRPAFQRAGHLESAAHFIGIEPDQHEADSRRVGRCVAAIAERTPGGLRPWFDAFAGRMATQIAFAQIHRFSHGVYSSSNLSVDGALADFGSFRALPNWEQAYTVKGMPPFGTEWPSFIRTVLLPLAHQIKECSPQGEGLGKSARSTFLRAVEHAQSQYEQTIDAEILSLFAVHPSEPIAKDLLLTIRRFKAWQARTLRNHFDEDVRGSPGPWLRASEPNRGTAPVSPLEHTQEQQARIDSLLQHPGRSKASIRRSYVAMSRTLLPRCDLVRESLQDWIYNALLYNRSPEWQRANLEVEMLHRIGTSRRVWSAVPPTHSIAGQVVGNGCNALWLMDPVKNANRVRVIGRRHRDSIELFGQRGVLRQTASDARHFEATIEVDNDYRGEQREISFAGLTLSIPSMAQCFVDRGTG